MLLGHYQWYSCFSSKVVPQRMRVGGIFHYHYNYDVIAKKVIFTKDDFSKGHTFLLMGSLPAAAQSSHCGQLSDFSCRFSPFHWDFTTASKKCLNVNEGCHTAVIFQGTIIHLASQLSTIDCIVYYAHLQAKRCMGV